MYSKSGMTMLDIIIWFAIGSFVLLIALSSFTGASRLLIQTTGDTTSITEQITLNQYIMSDLARGPGDITLENSKLIINDSCYTNRDGIVYRSYQGEARKLVNGKLDFSLTTKEGQDYLSISLGQFDRTYKVVR